MPSADAGRVGSGRSQGTGSQPQTWIHGKARLAPNVLVQSSSWVRGVFEHAWAPMQALTEQVGCLPSTLLDYLLGCEGGFVVISAGASRYVSGPVTIRQGAVQNVAYVSTEDLARGNEHPLHVVGHLIDHYLGCAGQVGGPWLSEGGGVSPSWRQAGERLSRLFALGYGLDNVARSGVGDYFAQSLAYYCRDRQRLNVADPQIEKWLHNTLWNEAFWRTEGP